MNDEFESEIHLKNGSIIKTLSPIIYSGDHILITNKVVNHIDEKAILTSTITPYNLSEIKAIITHQLSKIYVTNEN